MDNREIRETEIWGLYEKGRNYHRMMGIYNDTDKNHRFYNGNQWDGVKLGGIEPIQKNFIKPIVKYKNAVIHDNLYAVHYSSENFENVELYKASDRYCNILNRYARRIWERDQMDFKGRRVTKDSAINDEGIIYVYYDNQKRVPRNEIVDKSDIYYGNENDDEIQEQPYILIRKRMPESKAREYAVALGLSEELVACIVGDNDTFEEAGEAAKYEVDNMTTIVYKMYKENGTVHISCATRWVTLTADEDTGLTLYPVAHFNWEEKKGSARGEGEVRYLIATQIEVNRTEMRRVLTVKEQAYPKKVADATRIINPSELNTVGGVIKVNGSAVDDVRKVVGTLPPAQMSPDVKALQDDLIQITRELAGAGEIATGQVSPENASGRAILAVQQAAQAPMTEQKNSYKKFVEDLARIWMDFLIAYSADGARMEEEVTNPNTGEKTIQVVTIPQSILKALQTDVKVEITPKGPYDKFAQEQTLENLLTGGYLTAQRVGELKIYGDLLDDDSVAPKMKITEAANRIIEEQKRISMIQARAQMMKQRANQFLMGDPQTQAAQVQAAQRQAAGIAGPAAEEEIEVIEDNPDDN